MKNIDKEKNYMDMIQNEAHKIFNISLLLTSMSNSFFGVGNDIIGKQLNFITEDLDKIRQNIHKAVGGEIQRQFKQAQQSTANIVNACLATVALSKKQKDETH